MSLAEDPNTGLRRARLERNLLKQAEVSGAPVGFGSKLSHQGMAGFSPWFHLPFGVPIFDPQLFGYFFSKGGGSKPMGVGQRSYGCGCQNHFGIPFWLVGEFTHFGLPILVVGLNRMFTGGTIWLLTHGHVLFPKGPEV